MNDNNDTMTEIRQPEMEQMTPGDWRTYLKENPNKCLVINDPDGVHAVLYDDIDESVTFYAYGSMGYDFDGTQAVLEKIAGESAGMKVQTIGETYGGDE